ncbi:MAG: UbiD family decarboxylase [Desulfobacterales bacterium]|nr:UbiD family decarboxylase [Desulfobacterales bacterium]
MRYKSLKQCVNDLHRNGHLVKIKEEIDPDLEIAEIQRRVYEAKGPALFFENVKGSPFPAVSNLFGTTERSKFIFRSTLKCVEHLISLKADPSLIFKNPLKTAGVSKIAFNILPLKSINPKVTKNRTTLDMLPQVKCWPDDGGAFVLLPQVYSEDPLKKGFLNSNMGMYRIQISGNDYINNKECGLHYQIRRDIGIHHANAIEKGEPLKISIFVGGPPAHTFSSVMPLPSELPEVYFAGGLAGRNFRYTKKNGYTISSDADFCITGTVYPDKIKPEGPFGDHLGYYSLTHDFPYLEVENVYHRDDAIWPFTVVGRPPQEDTSFGELIHELTGPMVPKSVSGLKSLHAVDAAGVHPLLLAIGNERYTPYKERKPEEILAVANSILGFNHCTLAKYLFISAYEDNPELDINNIVDYFTHILERVDFTRDLHFQTMTTIDTLDYSGTDLNEGSKLIIAAAGKPIRDLGYKIPDINLKGSFKKPLMVIPGILAIEGKEFESYDDSKKEIEELKTQIPKELYDKFPLILVVDDSEFTARNINNFLWTTFTRSNPSHDIYGCESFTEFKHWGCRGSLIIDARLKTHHAKPLVEDPEITEKVNQLAIKGGPLEGII